jgi:outer membrane protein OmpA-like peptidoglycan-associated protein
MREFDVKIVSVLLSQMALFGILAAPALGQAPSPAPGQPSNQAASQPQKEASPLYRITVSARTTKAINYRHLSGPTKIDFRGTILLPFAHGVAKVESKRGAVRIQAQFEKVDSATRFGPEFLTYVLWAISPEGRADNLGEVLLDNKGKSKLDVTGQLQAFALIVTAEPYFAVTRPSEVVVMENVVRPDTVGNVEEMDAKFDLLQRGQYSYVEASAQPPVLDPGTPLGLFEARNAVQIARAAGGEHYAEDSFRKAAQLLHQAEDMHKGQADKKQVEMTAREAVQTAEDARAITVKRREEERVEVERRAAAEREAQARADSEAAQRAKLEAQLATERAARERAEAEAARAAAQAQQQAAQAQAEQSAREKAEADAAREAAQAQQLKAQAEAEQSRLAAEQSAREKAEAEADAAKARKAAEQSETEKTELRQRLLNQLNTILQTRDSARGLIVNMSDVLFDTGSSTLKPGAREKLAKISGVVLAHPGLNLQVEGHTDSVGSDEMNQQLSERRAGSVRDYLVQEGVPEAAVTSRGFGKTQPVASNDTAEGRQRNRRVELVVTGDAIGSAAKEAAAASPK